MKCNYIPAVASISMIIGVCLGLFLGITLFDKVEDHPEPYEIFSTKETIYTPWKKDSGQIIMRHGYQREELLAELENVTGGVRLYSDQAGSLYMVYGSTTIPDASYRIEKRSWVKQ